MGASDPILGAPLTIALPPADPLVGDRPGSRLVVVHYRTSPTAAAVQWLSPQQTSSGQPFLFTQGEAILDAHVDPDAGQPGNPPDLRGAHHGPVGPHGRHERRGRRRAGRLRPDPHLLRTAWTSRSRRT